MQLTRDSEDPRNGGWNFPASGPIVPAGQGTGGGTINPPRLHKNQRGAMRMTADDRMQIWADYVFEDRMDPRVRPEIADSWRKCKAAGLNPTGGEGKKVYEKVYNSIRAANWQLLDTAMPIMQAVFEIVRKTHYLLVLTDSVGYVLETMGDDNIATKQTDLRFTKGALWNSYAVGTNAISIALEYDTPIQTIGADHYCRSHHGWTCSAAPIHGLNGEIIGCIDLSGEASTAHEHTLGLILAAAYGIEGQYKLKNNAEVMQSALESAADSVILIGENYRAFWMNSEAKDLLRLSLDDLREYDFRALIPDADWSKGLWTRGERFFSDDTRVILQNDTLRCGVEISYLASYGTAALRVTLKKQKHLINSVNKLTGNRASYVFEDICTQDDGMKKVLFLAKKFASYDGNILIEGESGTGKELLAQAIHNAGSRAKGPFVTVNCASIPRDMLEAELFGYERGAFGGRFEEGAPGHFELARKGTLFLDEVSELPLEFQAKLLRIVETHSVTRIGGAQEIALDIRIIASSNQPLEQLVQAGYFRKDLFYRLNVLKLEIPPLRSRIQDVDYCAEKFVARLNEFYPDQRKTVAPEFYAGLTAYSWPGNVRELQNGIERAFFSEDGSVLTRESLRLAVDQTVGDDRLPQKNSGEAGALMSALITSGGDVAKAAESLEISRATMYRKMKKYGINAKAVK